jgi:hypothetical protein
MTVVAFVAVCPIMLVILAMTTDTADRQGHFIVRRRFVAFRTSYVLVLTVQFEIGFIVIEIPIFPVTRVMAVTAVRSKRTLVDVLFLVTGKAVWLCILEHDSQVAFLACGQQMFAGKRETGHPVVKSLQLPGVFMVARFAFLAFLPLVFVILLVTWVAVCFQLFFVQVSLVAAAAFNIIMLAQQGEFGLFVMVEKYPFPFDLGVATFALRTKTPFVFVVFLVARVAIGRKLDLVQIARVAADTFRFAVFSQQGVLGLFVVIEQYFFPPPIGVAGFALGTKIALVLIVLSVTRIALQRRVLEMFVGMAWLALDFHMLALQREMRFAMVEMRGFPVFLHMAILAFGTQLAFVLVVLFMAAIAFGWCFAVFFLRQMTVFANDLFVQVPAP